MAEITRETFVEAIEKMTVLELSKLVKDLEEKFDVSAAAPAMMMAAPAAAAEEAKEEQTEFNVLLTGFDPKSKIKVLKAVRSITSLGLKEAKEVVESVPKAIKEAVGKDEAEAAKAELEAAGGTVEIK